MDTCVITVRLRTAAGQNYTQSGGPVRLQTTAGALGAVTDHADGTYTATLTAPNHVGSGGAVITGTLNLQTIENNGSLGTVVQFIAGPVSLTVSTLSVHDTAVVADGIASTTVTVQLIDANGNPLTSSFGLVVIHSTKGTVGNGTQLGNTFTAALASSTTAGDANVTATVNGQALVAAVTVHFVPGTVSLSKSTVTTADSVLTADGISGTTVTVKLRDANNNPVTASVGPVVIQADKGAVATVAQSAPDTYNATLTAPTLIGTGTITAKVNAQQLTAAPTVRFAAGPVSLSKSTLTVADSVLTADGTSTTVATVHTKDSNGNPVTSGAGPVTLQTTLGTFGSVSQPASDTYTATLTSPTATGAATVSAKINAQALTATALVRFAPGALAQFLIDAPGGGAIPTQRAGHKFTIRISAQDAHSNLVPSFTGTAVISSTGMLFKGLGATASFLGGVLAIDTVAFTDGGSFTITATQSGGAVTGTSAAIPVALGQIVYVHGSTYPFDTLYTVNVDGSGDAAIPGNTTREYYPVWSPDGSRLLFLGGTDLWSMLPDGSSRTKLAANAGTNGPGTWSPNGGRIGYDYGPLGYSTSNIWLMNADGSSKVGLTSSGYLDSPAWSPDATKIVYHSGNDGYIHSMNADGTGALPLIFGGDFPAFSSDGTKIAYRNLGNIWVMNPDGSGATKITTSGGVVGGISWSPDGGRFAYISSEGANKYELWVVNSDGSNPHVVSAGLAEAQTEPAWRP